MDQHQQDDGGGELLEREKRELPEHIYMKGSEKSERFMVVCRGCQVNLSMPSGVNASWASDLIAEFIGTHEGCE